MAPTTPDSQLEFDRPTRVAIGVACNCDERTVARYLKGGRVHRNNVALLEAHVKALRERKAEQAK